MSKPHTRPPKDLDLQKALHEERHRLEEVDIPIVTVSATFRKELADKYQSLVHTPADVVYSRAHYSMAEAVRREALKEGKTTHLSDPTNFVSLEDWKKIEFTKTVGQLMARYKLLKWLKDKIDTLARSQLPISQAITPSLLYLTGKTEKPLISLHYEAGNILSRAGKTVLQVITDPQVRPQYLDSLPTNNSSLKKSEKEAQGTEFSQLTRTRATLEQHNQLGKNLQAKSPVSQKIFVPKPFTHLTFAVFDQATKEEFLQKARELNKTCWQDQVIVTGPPVDPRIIALAKKPKELTPDAPINLAITTGGLGTNLAEIRQVLDDFAPLLTPPEKIRLFLYAGTHRDFRNFFEAFAENHNIRIGNLDDDTARIRILYEDSIIDANENLIRYAFPWAHGFITKPSGDMAYDAAAAGCFLLFLEPWGEWEENIQKIFTKQGVGRDFHVATAYDHFTQLLAKGLLQDCLQAAHQLPSLFREGSKNIISIHQKIL